MGKLDSKDVATHISRNGVTGNIARWYYLQHDGRLFRWSVKDACWEGTSRTTNGLEKL